MNSFERVKFIEDENKREPIYKMATVVSVTNSNATIKFWGESTSSSKVYKRLSSYTPVANDEVILMRIHGSYVILGKVV